MIKNITLSAEERLIHAARSRAHQEKTTLNDLFRQWLERYSSFGNHSTGYAQLMKSLKHVSTSKHYTRQEMNER